ncbi:MAG: lipopolysaccharide heptosyltransferase II [Rhodoferax sp.]
MGSERVTVRTLVVAPQWIGDAVMTEPLLRRLHAQGQRLCVGALPWVAPVYRTMPQVAEVLELPFAHGGLQWRARWALARRLRGRFDRAYVCPNSFKSALLPALSRIPERIGYHGEARYGVLTHRLPNPPKHQRPPMVSWYSALAGAAPDDDVPRLSLAPERLAQTLARYGLQARGYGVLAPGAEYGPAKRWPAESFAAVAAAQTLPVLLLGSGKEAALCAHIAQGAQALCRDAGRNGAPVRNLAGQTSLDDALALIAGARWLISNDSGLMHVGAGFGIDQIAVFGSSSPLHTPPLNAKAQVLWLKNDPTYQPALDCAPCFARDCPLGHTRCLAHITPQQVLACLAAIAA